MKTLIIGDLHGCYFELQELLDRSGIADSDAIIGLGDIVDRGPETPQVLNFFKQHPGARSLMGNHERKHVRASRGGVKLSLSQVITRWQTGETYPEALAFMDTFPTWIELPEAVLVHGYLEPGVPLEEQLPTVLCGTMGGEKHLRIRYNQPWYALYEGDKPVIAGHHDYTRNGQPFIYQDRIFGLDTSCVHGKILTGLVLPDFTIVSVKSRQNHWYAVRLHYRQLYPARQAITKVMPAMNVEWDKASERRLEEIVEWAIQENERILARLHAQSGFEELTPRQQAKFYATEIGVSPLASMMHLARRGELDIARAKKIVQDPGKASQLAQQAGLC
jgi:hypothetical protein